MPIITPPPPAAPTVPRNGPCSVWTTGVEVAATPSAKAAIAKAIAAGSITQSNADALCAQMARAASDILYELSGRVYTGACGPVTVRPVARPVDGDFRGSLGSLGYLASWGSCASVSHAVSHYGCSNPPEIDLGAYPVASVSEVKIDGVVIPADEYLLVDSRSLIRMLPDRSAQPTQRYGWPTCQRLDLPDTEQGTFSVTYTYGQAPAAGGVLAARALGEYLLLPMLGDCSKLPTRVTSMTRQGISTQTASTDDILKTGRTGVYLVDVWLQSVNPAKAARPATVWSPDVGRSRRYPTQGG